MLHLAKVPVIIFTITNYVFGKKALPNYGGQKFPKQYLTPHAELPTITDFNYYLDSLEQTINYFGKYPNDTNINTALCVFLSKSLLKITVRDYRNKMQKSYLENLKKQLNGLENIMSHYIHTSTVDNDIDLNYKVAKMFLYDDPLTYSISEFNRNRLNDWILNTDNMNDFMEQLDDAGLPKEMYARLIDPHLPGHYIQIQDSDACISRVSENSEPINVMKLRPCLPDPFCEHRIISKPSFGYTLSHRMLNLFFRRNIKRCYLNSEKADLMMLDEMCASMYREAVYLARRGYFARDLFLEHITLCAMMGYEEFHRPNWFRKAARMINSVGCIKEFDNFELNRTKIVLEQVANNAEMTKYISQRQCSHKCTSCDDHPSALMMVVLCHGIRHAAHFME